MNPPLNLVESKTPFYYTPYKEEPLTVDINGKSYTLTNKTIGIAKDSLECATSLNEALNLLEKTSSKKGLINDYSVKLPGIGHRELNEETINDIRDKLLNILCHVLEEDVQFQNSVNPFFSNFYTEGAPLPEIILEAVNNHKVKLERYNRMIQNIRGAIEESINPHKQNQKSPNFIPASIIKSSEKMRKLTKTMYRQH